MSVYCFFLMIRLAPMSTLTDTLFPYTTLFRSAAFGLGQRGADLNRHAPHMVKTAARRYMGRRDNLRFVMVGRLAFAIVSAICLASAAPIAGQIGRAHV